MVFLDLGSSWLSFSWEKDELEGSGDVEFSILGDSCVCVFSFLSHFVSFTDLP